MGSPLNNNVSKGRSVQAAGGQSRYNSTCIYVLCSFDEAHICSKITKGLGIIKAIRSKTDLSSLGIMFTQAKFI